jgi:hypothetical protein
MMKECTKCLTVMELCNFSTQKTNATKLYSWCDACRVLYKDTVHEKPYRNAKAFRNEARELRNKAMELRLFSPEVAQEIKQAHKAGKTAKELQSIYGGSTATIYKTLKRSN